MNKYIGMMLCHGILIGLLTMLWSCSDENPWRYVDGEGGINPTITASGDVKSSVTVRAGAEELTAPQPEEFTLTLTKTDGSYNKTWPSFTLFPKDQSFKVGSYTMTATYGDIEDEGFARPCFIGTESFEVQEDRSTDVAIVATLANAMVSIKYTEAFVKYFKDYSATLHSEGGAYVPCPKEETRPAFLRPGKVNIALSITKQNGVSATLQPAEFQAEAQHHYRVTFDVYEGEVGDAQLVITFDESVEEENVTIDLTDELLTSPEPEVLSKGFTPGEALNLLEQNKPSSPVMFYIKAKGGIASATLTMNTDVTTPLGREFDICALNDAQVATLRTTGIKETGLTRNPGTLAQIDLTDFIATLPAGTHKFTLVVKDKMTKINAPVELEVTSTPLTFNVKNVSTLPYGSNQASIDIEYNGTDLKEYLSIEGEDDYGAKHPCTITSIKARSGSQRRSGSYTTQTYNVIFNVPQSTRDVRIYVKFKDVLKATATLKRVAPSYEVQGDAFARKAILKITSTISDVATLIPSMRVFCGNTEYKVVSRDAAHGQLTIEGLSPSMTYTLHTTIQAGDAPSFSGEVVVETEAETGVPNGDFESLAQKYKFDAIEQGGKYTRTLLSSAMQNHQSLTISEPVGWATTNAKTMGGSVQNSWFIPASVFNTTLNFLSTVATQGGMGGQTSVPDEYKYAAQNGANAMVVRNVAWDTAGTLPATDKKTAVPSGYYSSKVPNIANRTPGKLFLGTYAWNGTEQISEGVNFTSRPLSLSGYYRYINDPQDSGEKGKVTVAVYSGSTLIGSGSASLDVADGYTPFSVNITYTTFFKKATRLCIMFSSSDKNSDIKTTNHASLFLQESTGAVLVVDNLTFGY